MHVSPTTFLNGRCFWCILSCRQAIQLFRLAQQIDTCQISQIQRECMTFGKANDSFHLLLVHFLIVGRECIEGAWSRWIVNYFVQSILYATSCQNLNYNFSMHENSDVWTASGRTKSFRATIFWYWLEHKQHHTHTITLQQIHTLYIYTFYISYMQGKASGLFLSKPIEFLVNILWK